MPTTLEERVAYLEGKVEEHSYAWQDLKEAIRETNQRITNMEQKFEQRFIQIDQRLTEMDSRLSGRIDKLYLLIIATLASSIGSLIAAIISIVVHR